MMRGQDEQSRVVFHELCSLILDVIRSPPSSMSVSRRNTPTTTTTPTINQVSPAGFASLLLGVSLTLMLCGSLTFVIGFILMPWVLGLVMVLHLVGVVSNLSVLGRAFLCPTSQKLDMSAVQHGISCKAIYDDDTGTELMKTHCEGSVVPNYQ